jgi:hypothetical protein
MAPANLPARESKQDRCGSDTRERLVMKHVQMEPTLKVQSRYTPG